MIDANDLVVDGVRTIGSAVRRFYDFGGPADQLNRTIALGVIAGACEYSRLASGELGFAKVGTEKARRAEAVVMEYNLRRGANMRPENSLGHISKEMLCNSDLHSLVQEEGHKSVILDDVLDHLREHTPQYRPELIKLGECILRRLGDVQRYGTEEKVELPRIYRRCPPHVRTYLVNELESIERAVQDLREVK